MLTNNILEMSEALNVNIDYLEATKKQIRNIPMPQVDPIDHTREILQRCNAIYKPSSLSKTLRANKTQLRMSIKLP